MIVKGHLLELFHSQFKKMPDCIGFNMAVHHLLYKISPFGYFLSQCLPQLVSETGLSSNGFFQSADNACTPRRCRRWCALKCTSCCAIKMQTAVTPAFPGLLNTSALSKTTTRYIFSWTRVLMLKLVNNLFNAFGFCFLVFFC
jgi:hypothetical protein